METRQIRWCSVHFSEAVAEEDDPDAYWLCYASNYSGTHESCQIVEAEVTWR